MKCKNVNSVCPHQAPRQDITHHPCMDILLGLVSEVSPAAHMHHPLEAHRGSK